ncbi:MAG: hypothetical protein KJO60_07985 [Desulfofustis sp.]|nr:hypothetical protein [Desulfofustis sp.]MBT8354446.1 hypothetical protein [Desulfofustis sp.]NNK56496.1 hypothetical protein [Desulfofustis sp.]
MDNLQIARQMTNFNKTAFDSSFSAITMVIEQNEKMVDAFLSQATWMPEEGKKSITDWLAAYRNSCSDFKKIVDGNYAKVEAYFDKQ